ncbi:hypothetical protein K2173_020840 [Erythroxylum novogranatense]|uniref:U-box domain-containing protein n=1 Tax=Erythroxylum novogranatense TaxID=1862640 RepID=A0AAV8TNT8_9ROSI|nr:hypothetical protein K2173_020840 [Erythroxylum novogranatense]
MEDVDIPRYFLCPISLQIMKDPVTAITGITYDRESIEKWLMAAKDIPTCPVSMQPLPRDYDLTPNYTLLRLIQSWCTSKAKMGVDQIPTPKTLLSKADIVSLIKDLDDPLKCVKALKRMEGLASENERNVGCGLRNTRCMEEAGVNKAMCSFIIGCFKGGKTTGLEEALRLLYTVLSSSEDFKIFVKENYDFIDSLTWVLDCNEIDNQVGVKTHAMLILNKTVEIASTILLERLNPDFFKRIVGLLRDHKKCSQQTTKSALQVLIDLCRWGRNRTKIVEANAVFELIEMELEKPEKRITELILTLLAQLCSCADGRAQFTKHAGGIGMLAKRILRVSPVSDDSALHILDLIAKFSAKDEVLMEMLSVGVVSKLCMVMQADCATNLKNKARGILRLHSKVWNNSPCIAVYLLTRYPR